MIHVGIQLLPLMYLIGDVIMTTIDNYQDLSAYDIAKLFLYGLEFLGVDSIYGLIGGSVEGGLHGKWQLKDLY